MRDDNIYDVEDFEHVNDEGFTVSESTIKNDDMVDEDVINDDVNFESNSYVHPINNVSDNKSKKEKKEQ